MGALGTPSAHPPRFCVRIPRLTWGYLHVNAPFLTAEPAQQTLAAAEKRVRQLHGSVWRFTATGLALGLLGIGFGAPALLLTVVLAARAMPASDLGARLLLATLSLFGGFACALTALSVLRLTTDPRLLLGAALLAAALLTSRGRTSQYVPVRAERRPSRAPLLLGLLSLAVLYRPFLGRSTGEVMALLSRTTDSATHLNIVMGTVGADGFPHLKQVSGLYTGSENYPAGLAGWVWTAAGGGLGRYDASTVLDVLLLSVFGAFSVLTALLLRACLRHSPPAQGGHLRDFIVAALWGGVMLAGPGLMMLQAASYTQVVALTLIAAAAVLPERHTGTPLQHLIVLALLGVGVAHTWYLMLPVFALVALVRVAELAVRRSLPLLVATLALPFVAYPVLTGPRAGEQLTAPGATLLPPWLGLIALVVCTGVGVLHLVKMRHVVAESRLPLAVATVATLVLATSLAVTTSPASGVSYYSAKVALGALVLGAGTSLALAREGLSAARQRGWPLLTGLVALSSLALLCVSTPSSWPPGSPAAPSTASASLLNSVLADFPHGVRRGEQVWITGSCDPVTDRMVSKWLYDSTLTWTPAAITARSALFDLQERDVSGVLLALAADPGVRHVYVYVRAACPPSQLARLRQEPKVTVIDAP